jgi:DNA-directed RNA polymerase specialized sigma subunit
MSEDASQHFRAFAKVLERSLANYEDVNEPDLVERQRKQVNGLAALEDEFRFTLLNHRFRDIVYGAFFRFITEVKHNILTARPYFRERQEVFSPSISDAIRDKDIEAVSQYHINYHFVKFATQVIRWGKYSNLTKIAKKIEEAREALVVMNLPLVVSRARIFWSRTPKGHLSFMDFVQIGVEGLIAGVDKYSGEYASNWCGVAIGRMVGNFIENLSQSVLHFYPTDRRKLYRANKFLSRHTKGDFSIEDMVKHVNDNAGEKQITNDKELQNLMAAAGMLSTDTKLPDDVENVPKGVTRIAAPYEERPDVITEHDEATDKMFLAISVLPIFDQKLLRLRGVFLDVECQ